MVTAVITPDVSPDGSAIAFSVAAHGRTVECIIAKDALVQDSWLPPDTAEERLLQAFVNGRQRIFVIAERKALTTTHEPVILAAVDFARK
ncbi:DUF1488 family protein [Paraburkholderia sp. RL18-103-BIB-C]|uniref:DUF1488 family protein n=1 Tax=unclassified Paraburkholderia TaxID=2615204 RepID=UPI0038B7D4EE